MTIYIFPNDSNISKMNRTDIPLLIGACILIIFVGIIAFFGLVYGALPASQNGTQPTIIQQPPVIIQQPALPPTQQVQATAQQADNTSLASIIVTAIGVPAVGAFVKYMNDKGKQDHQQNEFRLKAMASTLSSTSNSLEETDKANTDNAKLLKMIKDDLVKEGGKISQATADAIEKNYKDCEADIQAYYYRSPPIKDEFDTCNDPIVQKVVEVRDKTVPTK